MPETERAFDLLFPTVLHMAKIDGYQELNKQLHQEIAEVRAATPNGRPGSWSCDVYTTISNNNMLHHRPGFQHLNRQFVANAEAYGRALDYPMDTHGVAMDMCWVNAYRRGQSQERHTHINYVFGGIYYLKAPPGASKLIVHSPTADTLAAPLYKERTDVNTTYMALDPEEGMMVIFSGNLRHGVSVSEIDEERISISMNANLELRPHGS